MAKAKTRGASSFRLTVEAMSAIGRLSHSLGISKASVVEIAVRRFAQFDRDLVAQSCKPPKK